MSSPIDRTFCGQVVRSLTALVHGQDFWQWFSLIRNPNDNDVVMINNSFIERSNIVSTNKNAQYLCFDICNLTDLCAETIRVCQPSSFHVDFKAYRALPANPVESVPLTEAVEANSAAMGDLIFLLIGRLDETIGAEVPLKGAVWTTLRFAPTNPSLVSIAGDAIEVNSLSDPDAIWTELQECCQQSDTYTLSADMADRVADALKSLRDGVYSLVTLPDGPWETAEDTLLHRIVASLEAEIAEYDSVLHACGGDPARNPQAYADILRIAYNFASESRNLISLIVSICDLKPLLLWAAIEEHFRLAQAFRNLPWSAGVKKPSFTDYQQMINGARNHAFHDLIRLDRAVHVEVGTVSLNAKSLVLFAPFAKKSGNALKYEDQELVDVLTKFTHAPETVVSTEFWKKNSCVMHALKEVFAATEKALVLLHNERQ